MKQERKLAIHTRASQRRKESYVRQKASDLSRRNLENGYVVCQINPVTMQVIHTWDSLRAASRGTGYSRSCISDCCNHKTKIKSWLYMGI